MDPVLSYIRDGSLPAVLKQARKLKCQAARYTLLDGTPYPFCDAWTIMRQIMCYERYTKEYVSTISEQGLWHSKRYDNDISGRPCTRMRGK